jgi:hypothetical protein
LGFRRTGEKRRSGGEEETGDIEGDENSLVTDKYSSSVGATCAKWRGGRNGDRTSLCFARTELVSRAFSHAQTRETKLALVKEG